MKKKLTKIFVIGMMLPFFSSFGNFSFAFDPPQSALDLARWEQVFSNFKSEEVLFPPTKKTILQNFCSQVLADGLIDAFDAQTERYSSQHSLFVFLLCKSTGFAPEGDQFSPFLQGEESSYLLENAFSKVRNVGTCKKNNWEVGGTCRLDLLSENLINQILEEYFILKQANIYGLSSINFGKEELEKQIHTFAQQYFFRKEAGKDHSDLTDDFCKGKVHKYPKTCKILKTNILAFQRSFENFRFLNIKKLFDKSLEKLKIESKKEKEVCFLPQGTIKNYDYLFCGLFYQENMDMQRFLNLVYNELLWYTLFTSYVKHQMAINPSLSLEDFEEIQRIKKTQVRVLDISNTTLRNLVELQGTYPLHIGMLIYQEDLLWLRDRYLSKLVNPFYSLYYKLQNVQIAR